MQSTAIWYVIVILDPSQVRDSRRTVLGILYGRDFVGRVSFATFCLSGLRGFNFHAIMWIRTLQVSDEASLSPAVDVD